MISREITEKIINISNTFPVLLLTGPRQVGKTTLLRTLMDKNRSYVTLDDPAERLIAKEDPKFFLEKYAPPVLIDEIQYAPELFSYIKMDVDTHKVYGNYWITGSQMFHLMKNVSETLAGRVGIVNMLGLSFHEIRGTNNQELFRPDRAKSYISETPEPTVSEVFELIFQGSLPELVANPSLDRDSYYDSYIQTYIERDVRDIVQVGNQLDFYKFLVAVAARSGEILNYSHIAQDVDIAVNTVKSWISVLRTSGIVYLLEPYHNNVLKRMIKMPKLYMVDTGLCAYLTRWDNPQVLEASSVAGKIFETFVISELLKSYYNRGRRPSFYYYRDTARREIDLLLYENNTLYPVEIKKGKTPQKSWIKHFSALKHIQNPAIGEGGVICLCDKVFPLDRNNCIFPLSVV